MTYDWLLLDADGTLFDYDVAEGKALSQAFAHYGVAFGPEALTTYREINAQLWRDFEMGETTAERLQVARFARLFESLDLNTSPDAAQFSQDYLRYLGGCVDLIPGARDLLNSLRDRVHLALITNGLKSVQRSRLAKSGLNRYFEVVIISDEIGVAKPDPRIFDVAFDRMGRPSKEAVLMVGDSLTSDMRGAVRYDIDGCWFNPQGRPREPMINVCYEIHRLEELLSIVDGERSCEGA